MLSKIAKRALIVLIIAAITAVSYLLGGWELHQNKLFMALYGAVVVIGCVAFYMVGVDDSVYPPIDPQVLNVMIRFFGSSAKPTTRLFPGKDHPLIYDCKICGNPYLPPGFNYPTDLRLGAASEPLVLLCQLNFALLPPLEGFPQDGILQFYLSAAQHLSPYGLDFDNPTSQEGWRVVYHPVPLVEKQQISKPPLMNVDDMEPLFAEELALHAKPAQMAINEYDHHFNDCAELYEREFGKSGENDDGDDANSVTGGRISCHVADVTTYTSPCHESDEEYASRDTSSDVGEAPPYSDVLDHLHYARYSSLGADGRYDRDSLFKTVGSWIGGYPYGAQEDPRKSEQYKDYSCLLLHLSADRAQLLHIGDATSMNFFIRPEDLARCDFSDVLFWWDC